MVQQTSGTNLNGQNRLLPLAGLTLAMLIWGSSFIALKIAFQSYSPWLVIFARMFIAALCFLPLIHHFRKIRFRRQDIKYLLLMTAFEPCLYFIFEAWALLNTTASQAGMITSMLPLMVAVSAGLWLHEKVGRTTWFGFSIAIAGAWWLSFAGESSASAPNPLLGNFLEFVAMICATGYTITLKHLSARYSPLFLTALQAFVGALFFLLPALLSDNPVLPPAPTLTATLAIIYLGTFVTVGAYGLYNYGVSRIPATQAGAFINLIPVFSVILGFTILGEHFTNLQFAAAGLVFCGVLITQWESVSKSRRRKREALQTNAHFRSE